MSEGEPAVFLDRDGTLIEDVGYLSRPSKVRVLPGVPEALTGLRESGYLLIITTNQSGIGRGLFTEDDYERVTLTMLDLIGVPLDDIQHCPHTPDAACPCRKPAPGMLLRAARRRSIDFQRSWTIGDRERDLLCGLALGCRAVYIGEGPAPAGTRRAGDFAGAARLILAEMP